MRNRAFQRYQRWYLNLACWPRNCLWKFQFWAFSKTVLAKDQVAFRNEKKTYVF